MADLNYDNMGNSSLVKLNNNQLDPDAKIKMSLDEIIHVYGPSVSLRRNGKSLVKKKPLHGVIQTQPFFKRSPAVKLPSSLGGGHFFVSKHSPLIKRSFSRRREMESLARAEINRALNAPLLKKNQEIIPATYKLIKTHFGFERVLVPTIDNSLPLVQVAIPRKPFQNFNKRLPPALIDTAQQNKSRTPILPPPLLDTAFKSEPAEILQSRSTKPYPNPPPLIDTALKPDSVKRTKSIASRLGPPSLIDTALPYEPMEVEESGIPRLGPPPLINTMHQPNKVRPVLTTHSNSVCVPPLIDTNCGTSCPPLVDLVSDDEDDVKPLFVNKKQMVRKNSALSLNERFTFIQN